MADIVAVEDKGPASCLVQALFDGVGQGRFAGAGQAGEPERFKLGWPFSFWRRCRLTVARCQTMLLVLFFPGLFAMSVKFTSIFIDAGAMCFAPRPTGKE